MEQEYDIELKTKFKMSGAENDDEAVESGVGEEAAHCLPLELFRKNTEGEHCVMWY